MNDRIRRCRMDCGMLLLAATTFASGSVQAAWDFVPQVTLGVATEDNPRLSPQVSDRATSTRMGARATLTSYSERGEFYIRPQIASQSFADSDKSDLDRTNYFLRTLGEYRWRRATVGFSSDYRDESVIDSELVDVIPEDPDVEDPVDTDTGQIRFLDEDRERLILTPYVEFNLSPRSAVRIGSRYIDTNYTGLDDPTLTGRADFEQRSFSAGIVREVDQQNEITAQVFASEFEASDTRNTTDTVGIQGIFSRTLSQTLSMNITAGVQRDEFKIGLGPNATSNADTTFAFNVGLRRRTERTTMNFDVRNGVNPTGNGFLSERQEFRFYAQRQLSERLALEGGVRLTQTEALDEADPTVDRDYLRADIGIEVAVARRVAIELMYDYARQEFADSAGTDADSNSFRVSVRYRGLSRRQ